MGTHFWLFPWGQHSLLQLVDYVRRCLSVRLIKLLIISAVDQKYIQHDRYIVQLVKQ